jgi:hypothetical protein
MWWLLWVGLAALGLYSLHRLALWAEARGWIYYRTRRMPPGAAGLAMMEVTSIIHPAVEHVVEELRSEQAQAELDERGEGAPPSGDGAATAPPPLPPQTPRPA